MKRGAPKTHPELPSLASVANDAGIEAPTIAAKPSRTAKLPGRRKRSTFTGRGRSAKPLKRLAGVDVQSQTWRPELPKAIFPSGTYDDVKGYFRRVMPPLADGLVAFVQKAADQLRHTPVQTVPIPYKAGKGNTFRVKLPAEVWTRAVTSIAEATRLPQHDVERYALHFALEFLTRELPRVISREMNLNAARVGGLINVQ